MCCKKIERKLHQRASLTSDYLRGTDKVVRFLTARLEFRPRENLREVCKVGCWRMGRLIVMRIASRRAPERSRSIMDNGALLAQILELLRLSMLRRLLYVLRYDICTLYVYSETFTACISQSGRSGLSKFPLDNLPRQPTRRPRRDRIVFLDFNPFDSYVIVSGLRLKQHERALPSTQIINAHKLRIGI